VDCSEELVEMEKGVREISKRIAGLSQE